MRPFALVLLALVFATPAAAETVSRHAPAVGPVFAGDAVAWGEQTARGASLVMMGAPGRQPLLVVRPLVGGPARVLARFDRRHARVGTFDLDAARAVWAVQRVRRGEDEPNGPARIVLRSL